MTVERVRGDLLAADCEALVNAVNTVGVMGKGIALALGAASPITSPPTGRPANAGCFVPDASSSTNGGKERRHTGS